MRATLVGLRNAEANQQDGRVHRPGQFGADVLVRHIIGLDPARKGMAIADMPRVGMRLAFCERNAAAARLGRCAAGRLFCRRRNRAPPPVWLYRGADGVYSGCRLICVSLPSVCLARCRAQATVTKSKAESLPGRL